MSKRIYKIWSLVLTVMLLGSMMVFAVPASADVGFQQFVAQTLPTGTDLALVNGSDIDDYTISSDGRTIYVVNRTAVAAGVSAVYKSTDGGKKFANTTAISAANTGQAVAATGLTKVAVATDNPDVVAATDGTNLWYSNNGGSTWATLSTPLGGVYAGNTITAIGVGPARSGTALGREYAIAVANPAAANAVGSDVLIIGNILTWASAGANTPANVPLGIALGFTGSRDWMAVKFTPNFIGDRSLVAVGAGAAGALLAVVLNTATSVVTQGALLNTLGNTTDFVTVAAGCSIIAADIALPTDFDATTSTGRRTYVAIASRAAGNPNDNGIYRADDNTARLISETNNQGMSSLAYAGTIDAGTLFQGRQSTPEVKYTTQPTAAQPSWTVSKKVLPATIRSTALATFVGAATPSDTLLRVAPDFAKSNKVFIGTRGAESAFGFSVNGGLTFTQKAIIDLDLVPVAGITGVGFLGGHTVKADGKTVFLMTRSTANLAGIVRHSCWKSSTPTSSDSWERIFVVDGTAAAGRITISAVADTMYLVESGVVNGGIYRTTDGGDIWNPRNCPTGYTISAYATDGAETIYVIDVNSTLYKSNTGAWTWGDPVQAGVGRVLPGGIRAPKPGELLLGGTGSLAYSTDGGLTFKIITGNAGEEYRVLTDAAFATNKTIWASNRVAAPGEIYRYVIDKDTTLVPLASPSRLVGGSTGLFLRGGVLYNAVAVVGAGCADRTLRMHETVGTQEWTTMNAGGVPGTGVVGAAAPGNTIYWRDTFATAGPPTVAAGTFWVYQDTAATAKPKIKAPKATTDVTIDPVTGRMDVVSVSLEPIGTTTDLVNQFEVDIVEKAVGWDGATRVALPAVINPTRPEFSVASPFGGAGGLILQTNRIYTFRVRACNQVSNDAVTSPWSDTITLNVGSGVPVVQSQFGPQLLGPTPGGVGVSTTPGFAWAPIYGATKYKVVLATDATLTKKVAEATVTLPSYQHTKALEFATTYFWSVQAVEPAAGPVSVGTFTTAAKPAPPPPTVAPPKVTPVAPVIVTPIITIPPAPAPQYITPAYIWAIIAIGAVLVIALIVLIARTRKPM